MAETRKFPPTRDVWDPEPSVSKMEQKSLQTSTDSRRSYFDGVDIDSISADEVVVMASESHEDYLCSSKEFETKLNLILDSSDWHNHEIIFGAMQVATPAFASNPFLNAGETSNAYYDFEKYFIDHLRVREAMARMTGGNSWIRDKRRQYLEEVGYLDGNHDSVHRVKEDEPESGKVLEFMLYACSLNDATRILERSFEFARTHQLKPRVGLSRFVGDREDLKNSAYQNLSRAEPFQIKSG